MAKKAQKATKKGKRLTIKPLPKVKPLARLAQPPDPC